MDRHAKIFIAGHHGMVGSALVRRLGGLVFNVSKPDGTIRKLVAEASRLQALGWRHRIWLDECVKDPYQWYLELT